MNPKGNEWNLRLQIMKTTLQAKGFTSMSHQVHPYAPSDENFGCKSCCASRMDKARDDPRWKGFTKFIWLKEKPLPSEKCDPVRDWQRFKSIPDRSLLVQQEITWMGKTSRKDGRVVLWHGRSCEKGCFQRCCELANKKTATIQILNSVSDFAGDLEN